MKSVPMLMLLTLLPEWAIAAKCRNWVQDITIMKNNKDWHRLHNLMQVSQQEISFRADLEPCPVDQKSPTQSVRFRFDEDPLTCTSSSTSSSNDDYVFFPKHSVATTTGRHNITAVPFTGLNCTGHAGHTRVHVFDVMDPCAAPMPVMLSVKQQPKSNKAVERYMLDPDNVLTIVVPYRSKVKIRATQSSCRRQAQWVKFRLFQKKNDDNKKSSSVLLARTPKETNPPFVMDNLGTLPAGNYTLETKVKMNRRGTAAGESQVKTQMTDFVVKCGSS